MNENLMNELRKAYQSSSSSDAFAKDITKYINQLEKEKQEEEKKKIKSQKESYVDTLDKEFHAHYKAECLGYDDVANLAVLVLNGRKPTLTLKDLEAFRSTILENLKLGDRISGLNGEETFKEILKEIKNGFKTPVSCCDRREQQEKEEEELPFEDRVLRDFLKSL